MFDAVSPSSFTPSQPGTNFAPLDPLRNYRKDDQSYKESSLASYAKSVMRDLKNRNLIEKREINEAARLMSGLRSGKLIMLRDPIYGAMSLIKNLPRTSHSDRHIHPLAQVNSTQLTSIWTLSRPKTVPRDFGNTNKSQIQQAVIEQIIEHYDSSQMDEMFHQRESLSAMDYGTIAIQVQYDERLNRLTQIAPILENQTKKVFDGYGYCAECLTEGVPEDFQADGENLAKRCKACGSYNVSDIIQPQMVNAPMIVGAEEIVQGDVSIDLLNIGQLNWDMRGNTQDSAWIHKRTEVSRYLVSSLLNIDVADEDPEFDYGLRVLNAMGTRGGSVDGWGRDNLDGNYRMEVGTTILDEIWLKPEYYAGCRAEMDEKTVSGIEIKKKQLYTEVFPDGMAIVGFNDNDIVAGIFNEKCRINSSVYHIQSASGLGKGTTDAIEISEHLNIVHSALMAQIKRHGAGGGTWYDSDVMTRQQAKELKKASGLVGIKMRGTQYNSVDQALKQIETSEPGQGNFLALNQLSNMLNIVFQTTDFTPGVTDSRVDINTLGGQQLLQAQNQQRSAAPLRLKGYLRARVFEEVLELVREHIKIPKFFGSRDKFSLSKGKFISGKDLPDNIKCDSVPDSELPVNRLTRRDNLGQFLTQMGQSGLDFVGLVQAQPRLASWMANEFHVEMPLFNYTEILVVCQKRLDEVLEKALEGEQIMQLMGQMMPPETAAEQVVNMLTAPITATEDNLVIKAQVLAEYLDDDEASKWSPLQKAAVQALIWRHYQSDRDMRIGVMSLEQDGQLGLQAKQVQAEMAMQAPMMAQQNAMQQEQSNQQMQGEAASRLLDMANEEDKFAREQESADLQLEREKEKEAIGHERSLELEKMKLKGRNKPAGAK